LRDTWNSSVLQRGDKRGANRRFLRRPVLAMEALPYHARGQNDRRLDAQ
jgi:hypothetical protein